MKGIGHIAWVIITIIIALIVLAVLIVLTAQGQKTVGGTFSEADLMRCCSNWCTQVPAYGKGNAYTHTNCRLSDGSTISMEELCGKLGRTGSEQCVPPLCKCD